MKLVKIESKDVLTSSLIMADGMDVDHRAIMKLIDKYSAKLADHGELKMDLLRIVGKKSGRPTRFAWLNESHFLFIATLMRNTAKVVEFKSKLALEFMRQRRVLAGLAAQRHNADWIEKREQGKLSRREETDTIKKFIEYAKTQGSETPERYYANISKMENKALFVVKDKFPNLRDVLSGQQLHIIASADIAVAKAIQEGMDQELPYKEIYQLAKKRVLAFAEIVGQSLVPGQNTLAE